ncbi:MAG: helix-turn-helix domain-containing protein [Streptosporangiaceae bacterium]
MSAKPETPPSLAAFAEELRAHRAQAGMSRDELAAKVSYSPSLIAMIETGRRSPSRRLGELLDVVFSLPGTFARLEKRLRDVPFPASFRPFVPHEAEARALRSYENALVPGLFQTEAYARAVLSTRPNTSEDGIEELVAARMQRQDVLAREEPPLIWSLIDEAALYRQAGTAEIMRRQLGHLAEVSRRPNITIQVVPYTAGPHSGLLGAFVIAELDDAPQIAYLETAAEGETVEDPSMLARLALIFDTLRSKALPDMASKDLIIKVTEERWKA